MSGAGHRFTSADPLGGGYAYAGDSPANYVDPSGMVPEHWRGGGGGSPSGTYTSAYCDSWAVRAGLCIPSSDGGGGGGTSQEAGLETGTNSRCISAVVMFGVEAFFGFLGILVNGDIIAEAAYDVLTQFQWEGAFTGLGIESITQFIESFGWWLLGSFVIPNLGELLPWWAIPGFLLEWTPPAWAARAVVFAGTIAIGAVNLAEACS